MASPAVLRRYASALYVVADKAGVVDTVQRDLALVRETIQDNPALSKVLLGAVVQESEKKGVVNKLFGSRVDMVTIKFLEMLIDNRRADLVQWMEAAFRREADEKRNVARVVITSAVELSDREIDEARASLSKATGKDVLVETQIDPGIIGGLVVRIGDRLIDGSVRGHLFQLKKALTGAV